MPVVEEHYGIRCGGIPKDEPNYILKEPRHTVNHCEHNAAVASWCDDFVNPHFECKLSVADEYSCKCDGKVANCPIDCVGGVEPVEKLHHLVRCKGIPMDQPNYFLKKEE